MESRRRPRGLRSLAIALVLVAFLGVGAALAGTSRSTAAKAGNPFAAFADIPARARYQFLLDDAEYEIATFIQGPVCNGSMAVNSVIGIVLALVIASSLYVWMERPCMRIRSHPSVIKLIHFLKRSKQGNQGNQAGVLAAGEIPG